MLQIVPGDRPGRGYRAIFTLAFGQAHTMASDSRIRLDDAAMWAIIAITGLVLLLIFSA
jgi:hypothetical protein